MILPGKHLKQDRALIGVGGEILGMLGLEHDPTVSELWERVKAHREENANPLSFDWFLLSLSFLFSIGVVTYDRGVVILEKSE